MIGFIASCSYRMFSLLLRCVVRCSKIGFDAFFGTDLNVTAKKPLYCSKLSQECLSAQTSKLLAGEASVGNS